MKELCSSTVSARGSTLNWRKGQADPEEECEESTRQSQRRSRYGFKSLAT
jgi:hypothetical protein